MSLTIVDGLPTLEEDSWNLSLRTCGLSAYIRSPTFIARFSLESGRTDWLIQRSQVRWAESTWKRPRRIEPSDSNLWIGATENVVAEILPTEGGEIVISARDARNGSHLWEQLIPIPETCHWAEPTPAWPGAQTEEIHAFFGNDPHRLIVCLMRQSRRSGLINPSAGIEVRSVPTYACQTDASRFNPLGGSRLWNASFPSVRVDALNEPAFTGLWTHGTRLGIIDFESGTNRILHESPHCLGWPVRDDHAIAVPWHSKRELGIDWVDLGGKRLRQSKWERSGAYSTQLHATEGGLAMQTNHAQMLWWLGREETPRWQIRAKPYIYNVHSSLSTDVFVGTDGRGGRLLAFNSASGRETLNIKPVFSGAGKMTKLPGDDVLVGPFGTSKSDPYAGLLCIVHMRDRGHEVRYACCEMLGTWQHGAVCNTGARGERIAVIDIRG